MSLEPDERNSAAFWTAHGIEEDSVQQFHGGAEPKQTWLIFARQNKAEL